MNKVHHLFCVSPPQHISMKILNMQKELLENYNLVSALALPCCIPLFYIRGRNIEEGFTKIFQAGNLSGGHSVRTGACLIKEAAVYLETDIPEKHIRDIRQKWNENFSLEERGLIPCVNGIFLCQTGSRETGLQILHSIETPVLSFDHYYYSLLRIQTAAEEWHKNIFWEFRCRIKSGKVYLDK